MAAHLNEFHRTIVCRGTPVENHWYNVYFSFNHLVANTPAFSLLHALIFVLNLNRNRYTILENENYILPMFLFCIFFTKTKFKLRSRCPKLKSGQWTTSGPRNFQTRRLSHKIVTFKYVPQWNSVIAKTRLKRWLFYVKSVYSVHKNPIIANPLFQQAKITEFE